MSEQAKSEEHQVIREFAIAIAASSFKLVEGTEKKKRGPKKEKGWYLYFYRSDGAFLSQKKILYRNSLSFQVGQVLPLAMLMDVLDPVIEKE